MMRRIGLAGMIVGAALALTGPALADKIVVGSYPTNPPFEYKTESGTFEGFEVDVVNEVGKRLGMDVEFQDIGFQALFAATTSGRIDVAISSITITNDRLKSQSFTQPYYDSDRRVVGKDGPQVKALADLKGKIDRRALRLDRRNLGQGESEKLGFAEVKGYDTQQNLLLELQNGRVDGGVGDLAGLQYAFTKMQGLKILERIKTGEQYGLMVTKDHPLVGKLNDALTEMKKDGTLAEIHKKWFGIDPEPGTSTVTRPDLPKAK